MSVDNVKIDILKNRINKLKNFACKHENKVSARMSEVKMTQSEGESSEFSDCL